MPLLAWARERPLMFSQLALLVGALIRVVDYITNRPLSIDESFIALNLIERSASDLLRELYFKQAAPVGFLEVQKLAVTFFGKSEYALRLVPLVASLLSLVFFYRAGKRLLPHWGLPVASIVFALMDPAIYYGATVKQYALDVAVALLLYVIASAEWDENLSRRQIARLTVVGVVVVWFSHASAFVLAAVGITLAVRAVERRRWRELAVLGPVAVLWLTSFAVELRLTRSNLSRVQEAFGSSHVLLGGTGSGGRDWFETATAKLRYLVGLEDTATGFPVLGSLPSVFNEGLTVLIAALAVIGFVSLAMKRPRVAVLFGAAPALVVIASAFQKYPLVGRTLLFLLPSIAFCVGEGVRALAAPPRARQALAVVAATLAIVAIALLPAIHLAEARASEGLRPALRKLADEARPDDTLYIGHLAQYGFVYYSLCNCAGRNVRSEWPFAVTGGTSGAAPALRPRTKRLVVGVVNLPQGNYRPDVRRLAGRGRVWLLMSEIQAQQIRPFLAALRRDGRELRRFGPYGIPGSGASLYLFDLSHGA